MKYLTIAAFIALSSTQLAAQEITKEEDKLMKAISFNCSELPKVKFPRPTDLFVDRDMEKYNRYSKKINESITKLKSLNPNLLASNYNIWGKPFNERLQTCSTKIKETEAEIAKQPKQPSKQEKDLMGRVILACDSMPKLKFPNPYQSHIDSFKSSSKNIEKYITDLKKMNPDVMDSAAVIYGETFNSTAWACENQISETREALAQEAAVTPSEEARKIFRAAQISCSAGIGYLTDSKFKNKYKSAKGSYKNYVSKLKQAQALDPRIDSWGKTVIDKCRTEFAEKFAVIRDQHLLQDEANTKAKTQLANSLGFEGVIKGISNVMRDLKKGKGTVTNIQTNLIEADEFDVFRVQSVAEPYVIYAYVNSSEFMQIAVVKKSNKFYNEGTMLDDGFYKLLGVEEFTTVLGATQQVLVLELV